MRIRTLVSLMLPVAYAMPALATVAVTTPTNNATVGSTVQVVASSSTTCAKGVASSGIYIDNALTYTVKGTSVNTAITLKPGKHSVVVQEWDNCGGASTAPLTLTVPTVGGVTVASPANGATVGTPAPFVASATTNCAQGVAAMGVYVNNSLMYKANGATLNAPITMGVGQQTAVVQAWDNCGGSTTTPVTVAVTGTTIPNIQVGRTGSDVQHLQCSLLWHHLVDVAAPDGGFDERQFDRVQDRRDDTVFGRALV
jgi:phospholipase C